MNRIYRFFWLSFFAAESALAAGGSGLPWEGPLAMLQDSLTGPVAGVVAVLAIFASGATLIWGGEMSGVVRSLLAVVFVLALVVAAAAVVRGLFGTTGALII